MELKLLKLALERLSDEVEFLKMENREVRKELSEVKRATSKTVIPASQLISNEDELLKIVTARSILNVSRNVFLKMVQDGIFKPIRLNLRTIRYSRLEIQKYIHQQL